MTFSEILQALGIFVTVFGFVLVIYQIRQGQRNAMMGSLMSAIANHWMLYEERSRKVRSGQLEVSYPYMHEILEECLRTEYQGNLAALAENFLWEPKIQMGKRKKDAVFEAITREFALHDMLFNLYEEEFIAGKYLQLTSTKLWEYWEAYLRKSFGAKVTQNHWRLRAKHASVFPKFVEFVEKEYLNSTGTSVRG
jgi:hypothetical protein